MFIFFEFLIFNGCMEIDGKEFVLVSDVENCFVVYLLILVDFFDVGIRIVEEFEFCWSD